MDQKAMLGKNWWSAHSLEIIEKTKRIMYKNKILFKQILLHLAFRILGLKVIVVIA